MNVFIFYGSVSDVNSKAFKFVLNLTDCFKKSDYISGVSLITADTLGLNFVNKWDDLSAESKNKIEIKNQMMSADLLVFISPVFLHNVSAYTKLFLDNFADWTHTMPLIGKIGFPISLSSNNGNVYVNDYLKKIMNFWGMITLEAVSIELANLKTEAMDSYFRFIVNTSLDAISNVEALDYSYMNEIYYGNYKNVMNYDDSHPEKQFFKKIGYAKCKSFREALNSKLNDKQYAM